MSIAPLLKPGHVTSVTVLSVTTTGVPLQRNGTGWKPGAPELSNPSMSHGV